MQEPVQPVTVFPLVREWEYLQISLQPTSSENSGKTVEVVGGWHIWIDSLGRFGSLPRLEKVVSGRDGRGREVTVSLFSEDYAQLLNERGAEGWELMSVLNYAGSSRTLLFKRPRR